MSVLRLAVCIVVTCLANAVHAATPQVPQYLDENGYRTAKLRAPTPTTVPGATTLSTSALIALLSHAPARGGEAPVLIDVQALALRPARAPGGLSWLPNEARWHIPGSVWLPNVGFAELDPAVAHYFDRQLKRVSGGDRRRPLVFYCSADCWLSWNAVQRAARMGYDHLYWYPEGVEGWREHGRPLERAEPVPIGAAGSATLAADAKPQAPSRAIPSPIVEQ